MGAISSGLYQTACEGSPHKNQIDQWLNEDKANAWISRELKKQFGEDISDKSVAKYRKYRDEYIQKELEKSPIYQGQIAKANDIFVDKVSQIKAVDVIQHLADTIENCADMIGDARNRDIQIKTVQDMRFMQMTMLDAIKLYGDTVLKAQRFQAIEENPELIKPTTININVKSALKDVLKEVMNSGNGYGLIDKLRSGIGGNNGVGNEGDIGGDRSSIMDGNPENIEGEAILVSES